MGKALNSIWLKKVGLHRGAPRVWIETNRVQAAGLSAGTRFNLVVLAVGIKLEAAPQVQYTVSSKIKGGRTVYADAGAGPR